MSLTTPKCPRCQQRYPGGDRAGHCATCCRTFIGLGAFDAHRVGEHGTDRRCDLQPEESIGEKGQTIYGHWQDGKGHWHHGKRGFWKDEA